MHAFNEDVSLWYSVYISNVYEKYMFLIKMQVKNNQVLFEMSETFQISHVLNTHEKCLLLMKMKVYNNQFAFKCILYMTNASF